MSAWLSVVGIGEDGRAGLSPAACATLDAAEVLVGGARHLALAGDQPAERIAWETPFAATLDAIAARRGRRVVVLASGDPMWFGAGARLSRRFPAAEMRVLPHLSAFALAAARLAWALGDCATLSLHGRPLATLAPHLSPGARLIVLTRDGAAPAEIAAFLAARGWGDSRLAAFERLGGPAERRLDGTAAGWPHARIDDLNSLAIDCVAGADARPLPLLAGLPDECFEHDGQITKRHVRAATLAALAPLPGQLLWDVGAGSGSIAIEWLRAAPRTRALAVERDAGRRARIARNAEALGVPHLGIVAGAAPEALAGLETPDAVFVGGGASAAVVERCWDALRPGGVFVANAVTDATATLLAGRRANHGGELARISVSHAEDGGWRDAAAIVQYAARKP